MKLNEWLRLIAGGFVLLALFLGATVHPYWNYFAVFVAVNLIQSADFTRPPQPRRDADLSRGTGWCPMMALLRKFGVQE